MHVSSSQGGLACVPISPRVGDVAPLTVSSNERSMAFMSISFSKRGVASMCTVYVWVRLLCQFVLSLHTESYQHS